MEDIVEAQATLNFAELPDGQIAMNIIYEGGFNRRNRAHVIMKKVDEWLKEHSASVSHETINGEDVTPTTLPSPRLDA